MAHPFVPRDDWYFTTNAGKQILFRIKDPATRASLDAVVNSFTLLPEPGDLPRRNDQTDSATTPVPVLETPTMWVTATVAGIVSFEVPKGWQQLSPEPSWTPDRDSNLILAMQWKDLQPGQEVEAAFLPSPAQMLDSTPVTLSWAARARHHSRSGRCPGRSRGGLPGKQALL